MMFIVSLWVRVARLVVLQVPFAVDVDVLNVDVVVVVAALLMMTMQILMIRSSIGGDHIKSHIHNTTENRIGLILRLPGRGRDQACRRKDIDDDGRTCQGDKPAKARPNKTHSRAHAQSEIASLQHTTIVSYGWF